MVHLRKSVVAAGALGATALLCLGGAASAAPAAGVKGSPQPELKPFLIGSSNYSSGSVAIEPDGTLVVARGTTAGDGKIVVCVLARGATKCASSVTLTPPDGNDLFGTPEVFVTSANHVAVLMETVDTDYLYSSVNGGKTFAAPLPVGTDIGVSAATLVGQNIVFVAGGHDGLEVESVAATATAPPAVTANPNTAAAPDVGVGSYKGGVLAASDVDGTDWVTDVKYAAKGKDFNASASYASVGSFKNEELLGITGDALVTEQTTGKESLVLRVFNGKTFGAAHVAPETSGGGPGWFSADQDPSGALHVFISRAFAPVSYELYEESSSTGASWSGLTALGYEASVNSFNVALDSTGAGLVLGTESDSPAYGFPVLAGQSASFALKSATVKKGKAVTAGGTAAPAAKGRAVALQVEKKGLWYTVATTHENAKGQFAFTIKGAAAGTYDYRAVVAYRAGYRMYGYSAARALKVTS